MTARRMNHGKRSLRFIQCIPILSKQYEAKQKLNQAGNAAANLGLLHAKGQYIARMDADDVSHMHRIANQVAYLQNNPQTIVLGTQATIINTKGKVTGKKSMPLDHDTIYKQFAIVHPMVHQTCCSLTLISLILDTYDYSICLYIRSDVSCVDGNDGVRV